MNKINNLRFLVLCLLALPLCVLGGCQRLGNHYETVSLVKEEKAAKPELKKSTKNDAEPENREEINEMPVLELDTDQTAGEQGRRLSARTETEAEEPTVLVFAGDIYLSEFVLSAYDRAGGIAGVLDEGLRAEIEEADLFIANQEFPFSARGTPAPDKQFTFRLPTKRAGLMREIGTDLVTLANNHALDYGTDALLDTCAVLDEIGIAHIGAGVNLEAAKQAEFIELNGKTYGFLAASRVFPVADWAAGAKHTGMLSAYDPAALCEVIRETKQHCDYLVLYVHWGIERNTMPESYQRTQGHQYVDAGADLVVGSHPHVLQGIEYYQGKPILYSLGNFIFGSSIPETMLVRAEINTAGETVLSVIPAASASGYTRALEAEKQAAFYEKLTNLSEAAEILENGRVQEKTLSSE